MPDVTSRRRLVAPAVLVAALAALAASSGPARAVDDAKPAPTCAPSSKDNARDGAHPVSGETADNLEITGAFLGHDPAKGAEATTINIAVKDLSTSLPSGTTSMHWAAEWAFGDGVYFVRALIDYTGMTQFEYGERVPETAAGQLPRYQYSGDTQGKLFEGPAGVVQIVIPQDLGGKAGSVLKPMVVSSNGGYQVVPGAAKTPTRGLSYAWDEVTVKGWTVGPCDEAPAPDPLPAPPPVDVPAPPASPSEQVGDEALAVRVLTRKARRGKRLKVRLRASEPVTALRARLLKGSRTVARGRLGRLAGTRTLTLKSRRTLRRGRYVLQLAGRDAGGVHRTLAARLRVR